MIDSPLVCVTIPVFNKSQTVARTIKSVQDQTMSDLECWIINDCSTDNSEEVILEAIKDDERLHYYKMPKNSGVSQARNEGIYRTKAPYFLPVDSDDAIAPGFLQVCVKALQEDRSLGGVYTGLTYIKPNGETGLSHWPGQWNFDEQLKRRNQVPTCTLMRREMLLRLGGYRSRYEGRHGAGAEDAELFLRAGAHGWKFKKVTDAGLFIYSWMSGLVSGDKEYKETDWLSWHPWAYEQNPVHPFASYATPRKLSHPVHQFDEPDISVVIPVGPNHTELVMDALDSLEAQTFRRWEAIIVLDGKHDSDKVWRLKKAYPYVKYIETGDTPKGAGFARNRGAEKARGSLLLFADADDWLYPEFLAKTFDVYAETKNAVYTDYVAKAYIGDLDDPTLAKDIPPKVLWRDDDSGETIIGHQAAEFDCTLAVQQPVRGKDPYLWCNITVLFPTQWFRSLGGFDESLPSWEDVDLWWRMARAGHCFTRLSEQLMVYRFYTGTRRQLACPENEPGLQIARSMLQYIREKYDKGEKPVGCGGCGRHSSVSSKSVQSVSSTYQNSNMAIADDNVVMVRLTNGNIGESPIVGNVTKTNYGMRAHGDTFLMKKEDQVVKPHVYEIFVVELPKEEVAELPPPEPVEEVMAAPVPIMVEDVVFMDDYAFGITTEATSEAADIIETEVDVIDEPVKPVVKRRGRSRR